MFGLFKSKEKGNILHSPCNGKVVPITEVPDPTFAPFISIVLSSPLLRFTARPC